MRRGSPVLSTVIFAVTVIFDLPERSVLSLVLRWTGLGGWAIHREAWMGERREPAPHPALLRLTRGRQGRRRRSRRTTPRSRPFSRLLIGPVQLLRPPYDDLLIGCPETREDPWTLGAAIRRPGIAFSGDEESVETTPTQRAALRPATQGSRHDDCLHGQAST